MACEGGFLDQLGHGAHFTACLERPVSPLLIRGGARLAGGRLPGLWCGSALRVCRRDAKRRERTQVDSTRGLQALSLLEVGHRSRGHRPPDAVDVAGIVAEQIELLLDLTNGGWAQGEYRALPFDRFLRKSLIPHLRRAQYGGEHARKGEGSYKGTRFHAVSDRCCCHSLGKAGEQLAVSQDDRRWVRQWAHNVRAPALSYKK
jgi:hypothetical protein